jgi:hypothetical protein
MILEGIVTTLNPDGSPNIAPMGPRVENAACEHFVLRPYRSSTTYRNLKTHGEGVLHVTDDVLLIARAAIGSVTGEETRPASKINGRILVNSCRYHEFRVTSLDDREDRATVEAETVVTGRLRDFFGLNRAKHAVVEAAILATRVAFLPREEILADFVRLRALVDKTGGEGERQAFELLRSYVNHQHSII